MINRSKYLHFYSAIKYSYPIQYFPSSVSLLSVAVQFKGTVAVQFKGTVAVQFKGTVAVQFKGTVDVILSYLP